MTRNGTVAEHQARIPLSAVSETTVASTVVLAVFGLGQRHRIADLRAIQFPFLIEINQAIAISYMDSPIKYFKSRAIRCKGGEESRIAGGTVAGSAPDIVTDQRTGECSRLGFGLLPYWCGGIGGWEESFFNERGSVCRMKARPVYA